MLSDPSESGSGDLSSEDRQPRQEFSPEPPVGPSSGPSPGLSWAAMLAWIAVAFAIAGGIAFFLVRPFFSHR